MHPKVVPTLKKIKKEHFEGAGTSVEMGACSIWDCFAYSYTAISHLMYIIHSFDHEQLGIDYFQALETNWLAELRFKLQISQSPGERFIH